jgi:hypothetical protein
MTDSKVKLRIELEGEGEIVEALADALREFFKVARSPAQSASKRLEDCSPAVSIPARPRLRRGNGFDHHDE